MLRNNIILIWTGKIQKLVKQSKVIAQQLKATENPNIVDIKSVNMERSKTSHKLFKTIRQAEKVFQVASGKNSQIPLCSETKRVKNVWSKNAKVTKQSNAFNGYASSYNVEILNYFNPELQTKDTKSTIRNKR